MSNLRLTDEERLIISEAQPRAADLRNIVEAYRNASIRLEVLAAFLRSGRGQPNMLYALALTDQVYETLTGQHLPASQIEV
ncbi:conserved hypothetical protein [Oceanicaulis sp. 350]|nr:conserved hypothetical protein [Oceanicaulis sp. 350]